MNNNFGTIGSWVSSFSSSQQWHSVCTSISGQYVYAVSSTGYIYYNNNLGASGSWLTSYTDTPMKNWMYIAISSSAEYVYVVVNGGDIYQLISSPTSQPT